MFATRSNNENLAFGLKISQLLQKKTINIYNNICLKAGLLRYKELQLQNICRGTEIVRMNSNNPRSPLETNYR